MTNGGRRVLVYEKLRPGLDVVNEFGRRGIEAYLPFGEASCLRRGAPLSESEIVGLARGFQGIVGASSAQLNRAVLEALPDLLVISKIGIGHDVIDIDAATDLGIAVTNTPSVVEIESVAEHAVALILACAKRLDFYTAERMRSGLWLDADVSAIALRGKTIGLLGFGRIARQVAERLQLWGVRIIASDLPGVAVEVPDGVELVDKPTLLAESDILSLHLAKDIDSPPVIDADELRSMKRGSILVNTSRGGNVDADALADALESGHLRAAGLDVFDREPPDVGHRLLRQPNLLLTPHLGAVTPESEYDMEMMAVDNAAVVIDGQKSPYLLNPEVHDRLVARGRR